MIQVSKFWRLLLYIKEKMLQFIGVISVFLLVFVLYLQIAHVRLTETNLYGLDSVVGDTPLNSGPQVTAQMIAQKIGGAQNIGEEESLVPKYVHIIWFYPEGTAFRFHHLLCLMSVKLHIRPKRVIFWFSSEPRGPWWVFAKKTVSDIALMQYAAPTEVFGQPLSIPEHQSDVARLDIMLKYGGIYLDLDVIALRSFDPLLTHQVTLGAETPELLGSGVILAKPNATFLVRWREAYRNYDAAKWNYNSVVVPMRLAQADPDSVNIDWFNIHRPNWFEREWLYTEGKLWNWTENYAVHLWYRTHNKDYDPRSIRTLNTTAGEIFRYVYYGKPDLLEPDAS